jgi:hypothetical protein
MPAYAQASNNYLLSQTAMLITILYQCDKNVSFDPAWILLHNPTDVGRFGPGSNASTGAGEATFSLFLPSEPGPRTALGRKEEQEPWLARQPTPVVLWALL